nr:exopolysaccharide biosynthesis protein [uncultured Hyphomonas sp.]
MSVTGAESEKTLLQIVEAMAAGAPEDGYTLRQIFDHLDESAFGAGLFLLALPCCIPFLYGVPQIVSLPMMALAAQMALGHEQPWLPDALGNRRIDRKGLVSMAQGGRKWLGWIETFSKPRFAKITGPRSERLLGLVLCIFCASILVPLPMTNTVPGFAVALAAFGLINRDGILVIIGCVLGIIWVSMLLVLALPVALTAVYFAVSWLTGLLGS